jgi:hypothetical protein
MEMSAEKSETMAFLGKDPVGCKIIVGYQIFTSKEF